MRYHRQVRPPTPGGPGTGIRRRWFLISAGILLAPLVALEVAYRLELTRIAERPPPPVPRLPPLVMHVAALELLHTSPPETHAVYPWTAAMALAQVAWTTRSPAMTANAIAARTLLSASAQPRGHLRWVFANLVLTTWISRHLTGEEALSTAVSAMFFGRGTHGLRDAADKFLGKPVEQLDAEEVARLMVLARDTGLVRHPDKWRAARDQLLGELRRHDMIDDAMLLDATARSVSSDPVPEGAVER